ncbi:RidA family protein [Anaerotruncus sp.]|uniref:RidA family protein n=1 Tax=Anaerotruncus TaxID=244127 RepID=UPI00216D96FC|nr:MULTISPECIES: RidA family protein [Anaerotruncus]MCI8492749.1 RidA family protein [Anaerotruncus sp.]
MRVIPQAAQALRNLDTVLSAAGAERSDVVMCRVYLPDVAYWPDLNEEYACFFGDHKPARVVVPTNNLYGGCLVEVEAVAQLKRECKVNMNS